MKKGFWLIAVMVAAAAIFTFSGCATTADLAKVQQSEQQTSAKADQALQTAQDAQEAAAKAAEAAARAEEAAKAAEERAAKAEEKQKKADVVFEKSMRK